MMRAGFDPECDLPEGLSEADLLDWVEADAGQLAAAAPGSALARVSQAKLADARLARLLEAMRIDRAALGSLETPAPPASVAHAVLEEHERQALLALSDMATMGPRAASRDPAEEAFSFSAMPGWFKPAMALAALLALAFGAWQLIPLILPQPQPGSALALEDRNPTDVPELAHPAAVETMPTVASTEPVPVIAPPRERVPTATEMLASRIDLPVDQALELAASGRLLIVVDVAQAAAAEEAITRVSRRAVEDSWRVRDADKELIAAMVTPAYARLVGLDGVGEGPLSAAARGPLGQIELVMASAPSVYVAEASASPKALLSLLDGLSKLGTGIRVVSLDEPLPGAGVMPPPATESLLLWWERDPATWQPWTAIPVRFIETR